MNTTSQKRNAIILLTAILAMGSAACAATINEDFESLSLGSTNLPSDWIYIDVAGQADSYVITNGALDVGLGIFMTAADAKNDNLLPAAYIANANGAALDATKPITGSFDFMNDNGVRAHAGHLILGAVQDGITETDTNELFCIQIFTDSFGNRGGLVDGARNDIVRYTGNQTWSDWTAVSFTWTPTNGLMGNISASASSEGGKSWSVSYDGFTLGSQEAFIGIGTSDYYSTLGRVIFDNISITGSPIMPAGTVITIK